MKELVKKVLYAIAPRWTTAFMSARARAHSHRVVASWGCASINQALVNHFGNRVLGGPFAGLALTPMTYSEHLGPYLLGLYESELDEAWETVFAGSYRQIIDIGAKFGYYAIGLAKRYPQASVIAFDTDWWARKAIHEMEIANGVNNIKVEGFCSSSWLHDNVEESSFIICDCDGYESILFDSAIIPRLKLASLIIETHDCFVPGVFDKLKGLFDQTHNIHVIDSGVNLRSNTFELDFLTQPQRDLASREVRPPQQWLFCLPKSDTR